MRSFVWLSVIIKQTNFMMAQWHADVLKLKTQSRQLYKELTGKYQNTKEQDNCVRKRLKLWLRGMWGCYVCHTHTHTHTHTAALQASVLCLPGVQAFSYHPWNKDMSVWIVRSCYSYSIKNHVAILSGNWLIFLSISKYWKMLVTNSHNLRWLLHIALSFQST